MIERNIIAQNPSTTVIAEYIPTDKGMIEYQSEAELEAEFIRILQTNGYEYLPVKNNNDLLANLRVQISRLNNYEFSDSEWSQMLTQYLANKNEGIEDKTTKIQKDHDVYNLTRDNGTTKNIRIIDKDNIHNNHLQVINQYEADGMRQNRYDVSILVNGLPLAHIELKRRGIAIREAFNQITRYQHDSFGGIWTF